MSKITSLSGNLYYTDDPLMEQVIYKYPIILHMENNIVLPKGSAVVDFQVQDNQFFIWVLLLRSLMDSGLTETRTFRIIATGQNIKITSNYIKTVHEYNGLVWHLFEI